MVEVVVSDDIFFITKGGPCRQGMVEFVAASDDFFILKHLLNRSSRPAGKRSDSPVCFLRRKVPGCGRLPPNFAHDFLLAYIALPPPKNFLRCFSVETLAALRIYIKV